MHKRFYDGSLRGRLEEADRERSGPELRYLREGAAAGPQSTTSAVPNTTRRSSSIATPTSR